MNESALRRLLEKFRAGKIRTDDLLREMRTLPFEDLEFAKVDHHRALRCGFPEVIFCPGKTPIQIEKIARQILKNGDVLLATRGDRKIHARIRKVSRRAKFHEAARCITVGSAPKLRGASILVVSAGTSDIPVAEEARVTAETMGIKVDILYDVGVAGVHRLFRHAKQIMSASVIVVVAGMEGALPSVVGGLVRRPVIAVPTSVGYGASFEGVAPLLTMLNSCAAGVSVVNIDNGFGAGYLAAMIATSDQDESG